MPRADRASVTTTCVYCGCGPEEENRCKIHVRAHSGKPPSTRLCFRLYGHFVSNE